MARKLAIFDLDETLVHAAPVALELYIKDLRKVQGQGYAVLDTTMVDDSPEKVARQPRNHLQVKPYWGTVDDRDLLAITVELLRRATG